MEDMKRYWLHLVLLRYTLEQDYCALLTILNSSISNLGFEYVSILLIARVFLLVELFCVYITIDNFPV